MVCLTINGLTIKDFNMEKNKQKETDEYILHDVDSSSDWVNLEYVGESYKITKGVIFEKGTKSGLPKDIWENQRKKMTNWKEI